MGGMADLCVGDSEGKDKGLGQVCYLHLHTGEFLCYFLVTTVAWSRCLLEFCFGKYLYICRSIMAVTPVEGLLKR